MPGAVARRPEVESLLKLSRQTIVDDPTVLEALELGPLDVGQLVDELLGRGMGSRVARLLGGTRGEHRVASLESFDALRIECPNPLYAKVTKMIKSRPGNGRPPAVTWGSERATASEMTPRMPAQADHDQDRGRWPRTRHTFAEHREHAS